MLYHGSSEKVPKILKPFTSDHGEPYVYLTDNEAVACLYTVHILERPYNWFTFGFRDGIPVYTEFFKDALKYVYSGKSGYIYAVEEIKDRKKLKEINGVFVSSTDVEIDSVTEISDVYDKLLQFESEGKLIIERYEELSDVRKEKINNIIKSEITKYNLIDNPQNGYAVFIRKFFADIWENITIL